MRLEMIEISWTLKIKLKNFRTPEKSFKYLAFSSDFSIRQSVWTKGERIWIFSESFMPISLPPAAFLVKAKIYTQKTFSLYNKYNLLYINYIENISTNVLQSAQIE